MLHLTVDQAIADVRMGKFVIIVDDIDRENEGDLAIGGQFVSPGAVNFMTRHGRGLICVAMTGDRLDELNLPLMVPASENSSGFGTAFTISVEARSGVTTGISAQDRAHTIQTLSDRASLASDLSRPGHIFPLRANPEGVLGRAGQTEASVDLMRLAGIEPVAAICEIMAEDGTMARMSELEQLAGLHNIGIVAIADLIDYRRRCDPGIRRGPTARLPTKYGDFDITAYDNELYPEPDLALTIGNIKSGDPVLVRCHSECLTGDIFGSRRCDCGDQLRMAMERIGLEGRGVIIYLRQEGRGIGLRSKLHAYRLQDQGLDTIQANERLRFPADMRTFGPAARILKDLGVFEVRLLTNNPRKIEGLRHQGINIVERVPVLAPQNDDNRGYLQVKRDRLGHLLTGAVPSDDLISR